MKNIDKVTILDVIETYKLDSFIRNQLHYFVNQIEIFGKNLFQIICAFLMKKLAYFRRISVIWIKIFIQI